MSFYGSFLLKFGGLILTLAVLYIPMILLVCSGFHVYILYLWSSIVDLWFRSGRLYHFYQCLFMCVPE